VEIMVCNPLKGRLETTDVPEFTDRNTRWFENCELQDVYTITDMHGGVLISQYGFYYPVWIKGSSRSEIGYSKQKAAHLLRRHEE